MSPREEGISYAIEHKNKLQNSLLATEMIEH